MQEAIKQIGVNPTLAEYINKCFMIGWLVVVLRPTVRL